MFEKIILALAMALTFLVSTPSVSADTDTIVYSFPVNVGVLNPHLYHPAQIFAQQMIYDPLVLYGEGGAMEPCLAVGWEISDDGLEYTFRLREGVLFSDGSPFNAHVAVKNFDAIMANRKRHAWIELTNKIEKWEAEGELVFKITLNSPYSPTLNDLASFRPYRFLALSGFPDNGLTAEGIKAPIGTGPWVFKETLPNEHDLFVRNELYWGPKPKVKNVLIKVIPDPLSRAVAMRTGIIDLIYGTGQIGFDAFDEFVKDPRFGHGISPPLSNTIITLNTALFPTDDKAVRLALNYATDRDEIIRGIFLGYQEPAYFYCNPVFRYCDANLEPHPFDVDLAVKTLEEAGWLLPPGKKIREKDGKRLDIPFSFVSTDSNQRILAEVMQAQALKAGINLIPRGEEADTFLTHTREGNFNMVTKETWGAPLEPIGQLSGMRRPTGTDYHAQQGLSQKPRIDELISVMVSSADERERETLVKQIFAILHDEAVYIPIHGNSSVEVHGSGKLSGVSFATDDNYIAFEKMTKLK
ncbi:MAG: nickel ABC transporter substrate-binding protein [Deltaproteobacteria bacterium]|jgi:nickel transport system substrate-binding protein|nr:nickel ABC transporter substrate-binding protein [Deltaproteobacteria bacterium]